MTITFTPLSKSYFPLLLKWLEMPHVKAWWDKEIIYTLELVKEKFSSHIHNIPISNDVTKLTYVYIIEIDTTPIGYIQSYNVSAYAEENKLNNKLIPKNCCGIDIFIGEPNFLNKGLASQILQTFWHNILREHFDYCLVDPDTNNTKAIHVYEKAGFKILPELQTREKTWMMKSKRTKIIYITGKPGNGKYTIAKEIIKRCPGYILCDNQLINNPIFELLNYDGLTSIPNFAWDAIARIRDAIFDFITNERQNSYILTNNLSDDEGDRNLYLQVKQIALKRDALFIPVRLTISEEEHLKRITQIERRKRWKSIDPNDVYDSTPLLEIKHPNLLTIDVSMISAKEAAEQILQHRKKYGS